MGLPESASADHPDAGKQLGTPALPLLPDARGDHGGGGIVPEFCLVSPSSRWGGGRAPTATWSPRPSCACEAPRAQGPALGARTTRSPRGPCSLMRALWGPGPESHPPRLSFPRA